MTAKRRWEKDTLKIIEKSFTKSQELRFGIKLIPYF